MKNILPIATLTLSAFAAAAGEIHFDATVAKDGSGQYTNVQEAINAVPQNTTPARQWFIHVKPGVYQELVYIQREKRFIHLIGDEATNTVLTYHLNANIPGPDRKPMGTFRTPTVQIDAEDFTAENITFENSAGAVGQALAVRIDGDRAVFRRCRFIGWQDTIFGNRGRHYFESCHIDGATDFIFGGATEFYNQCHIHCKGNGYITAASTPTNQAYGLVFFNCKITGEPEVKTYLGRPWRPWASTLFMNTEMSEVVRPEGWHNWGQPDREKTTRYAEFHNTGPGADTARRVNWVKPLTAEDAASITIEQVLKGYDGWNPTKP